MTEKKKSSLRENVTVLATGIAIAVLFQAFLFKPFRIPSESMLPNLLVGDYLFVSKYSYGYSRFSLPFSPPLFSGRIWGALPERGDIAVFRLPRDTSEDLIKRVIGLPGDSVQMINGVLQLNGKPVERERMEDFVWLEYGGTRRATRWREVLPNGARYETIDLFQNSDLDNTPVFRVPPGHVFMMGDNRDNSTDSRVPNAVGFVPAENLIGRAEVIFFSVGQGAGAWEIWRWPWTIRFDRLFKSLR